MRLPRLLFMLILDVTVMTCLAYAQLPVLVTQTPTSGNSASTFFVFLPVSNIGSAAATHMQLTSVAITHMGTSVAKVLQPASLPFVTGSGYLGPTGVRTLDLEFDNSSLVSGNTYLIHIGGTYQASGSNHVFTLNRPVVFSSGFRVNHEQVVNTILAKFETRSRANPQTDDQNMAAFARGLPQVARAEIQVDPPLVDISFNDGSSEFILLNNVELPAQPVIANVTKKQLVPIRPQPVLRNESQVFPETSKSKLTGQSSAIATEMPMSSQARILNALGDGMSTSASNISDWLSFRGYQPPKGVDATVKSLRKVGGDGVFYFSTHAGFTSSHFYLYTASNYEPVCEPSNLSNPHCPDPLIVQDIKAGLLTHLAADNFFDTGINNWRPEDHFSINEDFMETYWKDFADNSFVYIDACNSASATPQAQKLVNEMFQLNASVYAGWNGVVGDVADDTSKLVFDRLLGANQFCSEDGLPCHPGPAEPPIFAQRPFDYTEVEVDLPLHGLGSDGLAVQLQFRANSLVPIEQRTFGLLAPSISYLQMDEYKQQLHIYGTFGTDPRLDGSAVSVQVGGTINAQNNVQVVENGKNVNIVSWAPDEIVVDLPLSGDGSAGNVQVNARGHLSNVAQLTEWRGDQNFHFAISGPGSLQQQQVYSLHMRADVRKWRRVIHNPPEEPQGKVVSANDSTGTYSSSGTQVVQVPHCGTDTAKWSGSGALVNASLGAPDNILFLSEPLSSVYDSEHMPGLYMVALSLHGLTCTRTFCPQSTSKETEPVFGPTQFTFPSTTFTFNFDNQFGIKADQVDLTGPLPGCDVGGPPRNGTFKWGSIAATENTAPNPESAR